MGYQLEVNQITAAGEEETKRIANIITVRTGSEFKITRCNVCGT